MILIADKGRFSKVMVAKDRGTDQIVALKQINRALQSVESSQTEYSILSGLTHKNIIKALAIFQNAPQVGIDTIVMEV